MAMSFDVTLPIDAGPVWPAACVRCMREKPEAVFRFRASRVGWDQIATLSWAIGKRPRVEAPACHACLGPLRAERLIRGLGFWIVALPLVLVAFEACRRMGLLAGPFRKYIALGAALVLLAPLFWLEMVRPPSIGATARGRRLDYEFRRADYASMFAGSNAALLEA